MASVAVPVAAGAPVVPGIRAQPLAPKAALNTIEAQNIFAIIEDCVEQLAVLEGISPQGGDGHQDMSELVGDEVSRIIEEQRRTESRYDQALDKRNDQKTQFAKKKKAENDNDVEDIARELRQSTKALVRNLKQNPKVAENIHKVKAERASLESLMEKTLDELEAKAYETMIRIVNEERERKIVLQQTIAREKEASAIVKGLQKELLEEKKQREQEIQTLNEAIAKFKDHLQEIKAKTSMDGKYMAKESQMRVQCLQKKFQWREASLEEERTQLQEKLELELRVNRDIEAYLKRYQEDLEGRIQFWMNKYDVDVESKQKELDSIKSSRAADLVRLQELTEKYNKYAAVVDDDRRIKEERKRQAEEAEKQSKAAVKIQAWWRGVRTRKELRSGSAKKKRGKSGKKSAKKSGGKKGGKKAAKK